MAGDLLRANAPESAPTASKTLFPSFVFCRTAAADRLTSDAFHSRATLPAGWCSVRAAAGAVGIMRREGGMTLDLTMTAEQARAVGAELIAAADVVDPPSEGATAMFADLRQKPDPERIKIAEAFLTYLLASETTIQPGNMEMSDALDEACGVDRHSSPCEKPADLRPVLRRLLELAEQPVPLVKTGRRREDTMRAAKLQRDRFALFVRAALLLIEPAAPATKQEE